MKESRELKRGLNRHDPLKGMAATGLALTAGSPGAVAAPAGDNRITKENVKPGTKDWLLIKTHIVPGTFWRSPMK
jgi:hypothetical protein